jgi:hypothetical protein
LNFQVIFGEALAAFVPREAGAMVMSMFTDVHAVAFIGLMEAVPALKITVTQTIISPFQSNEGLPRKKIG